MATFISVNRNRKIWGEKGAWKISFAPLGSYTTEDEKMIERLRKHPLINKGIVETGKIPKPKSNNIQGTRTAVTQSIPGKDEMLIRLGELRARLLRKDGSRRKDASDEDYAELLELQGELGV